MNPDHLFTVAAEFAEATGKAERLRARAVSATGDERTVLTNTASRWEAVAKRRREFLRASLHEALRGPIIAEPDTEQPVALWRRRSVEVRACTGDGSRVRVRCTPTQAVALGTALIGLAALTDQLGGGVLGQTLSTFPPNSRSTAEPEANDEKGKPA
ncbi:hypothetical protein B0E53_02469 [Micromonospora sp. MH33]|uniref:hypothetical protein n=1 Tax=Micromonospora sp. MH33 TaxID=1945509 RepID=UPI000D148737|nr:hypothetical protein [Micromonospora sp. MH33]PSK65568.1 hypothetical protein B0E53_02469 [Micromonospora sp. MH33]